MTDIPQIPKSAMKILHAEAWEVFTIELQEGRKWPEAFKAAVEHAFSHALEEGIIELPNTSDKQC